MYRAVVERAISKGIVYLAICGEDKEEVLRSARQHCPQYDVNELRVIYCGHDCGKCKGNPPDDWELPF